MESKKQRALRDAIHNQAGVRINELADQLNQVRASARNEAAKKITTEKFKAREI